MAVVERVVPATPERVFAVLANGWTYSDWVVGTAHISDVDNDWPQPGTHIYYQTATWPLKLKDKTVSVEADPPRSLLLRPRMWPLGEFAVRFTLIALNECETKVKMAEEPVAGALQWVPMRLDDVLLHWRNTESLRRLSDLAVRLPPQW